MRTMTTSLTLVTSLVFAAAALAQQTPPAGAPAGSTGLCKDGTYYSGATKKGACRGHKGVQDWYGAAAPAPAAAAPASAPAAAAAPAPSAAAPPAAAPAPSTTKPAAKTPSGPAAAAAPGGGPGLVWVNHKSKVYHCPGTEWYGKTKDGEYMSEADATAKGNRADHGKACK